METGKKERQVEKMDADHPDSCWKRNQKQIGGISQSFFRLILQ